MVKSVPLYALRGSFFIYSVGVQFGYLRRELYFAFPRQLYLQPFPNYPDVRKEGTAE